MRDKQIKTFYNPAQVLANDVAGNFSKSPLKPKLLLEFLKEKGFGQYFQIDSDFAPFTEKEFLLAHTSEYVTGFFEGNERVCRSNGLDWSVQFADSVRYTNSSLYHAILNSLENPAQVSFSPTSGFHHADPTGGSGFCTFSGQVIASTKLYRQKGLVGAYCDLDGHFGNSIEDSRYFVTDLDKSIPKHCNINPEGKGEQYINDFETKLYALEEDILAGKLHYIVFCHGADSHEWDDLGRQCSTNDWVRCSEIFYTFIKKMDSQLANPFPLALSLFGGYRKNSYNSVLSLHTADLICCLNILCDANLEYNAEVEARS